MAQHKRGLCRVCGRVMALASNRRPHPHLQRQQRFVDDGAGGRAVEYHIADVTCPGWKFAALPLPPQPSAGEGRHGPA